MKDCLVFGFPLVFFQAPAWQVGLSWPSLLQKHSPVAASQVLSFALKIKAGSVKELQRKEIRYTKEKGVEDICKKV